MQRRIVEMLQLTRHGSPLPQLSPTTLLPSSTSLLPLPLSPRVSPLFRLPLESYLTGLAKTLI